MTADLRDDRDRSEWLACLQAAAAIVSVNAPPEEATSHPQPWSAGAAMIADDLFAEFRRRCGSKS